MKHSTMQFLHSILFFAILSFVSCKGQDYNSNLKHTNIDTSTTFIREFPTYKKGANKEDTSYLFKAIREDVKQLNLENLENGFDSLNMRIWLGHSMTYKNHVVSIQRLNDKWSGQLITVTRNYSGENETKPKDTKEVKEVMPKSGWNKFVNNILSLGITTLPDGHDLQGYDGCGGGDGMLHIFEISTKHKYRFYYYCEVEDYIERIAEARAVNKIVGLLEHEFSFKSSK